MWQKPLTKWVSTKHILVNEGTLWSDSIMDLNKWARLSGRIVAVVNYRHAFKTMPKYIRAI